MRTSGTSHPLLPSYAASFVDDVKSGFYRRNLFPRLPLQAICGAKFSLRSFQAWTGAEVLRLLFAYGPLRPGFRSHGAPLAEGEEAITLFCGAHRVFAAVFSANRAFWSLVGMTLLP